jgi:pyruvate/2-oxoglutarate dehydrogenase complex dihydrolipoamide dehydrogenase (E3) component
MVDRDGSGRAGRRTLGRVVRRHIAIERKEDARVQREGAMMSDLIVVGGGPAGVTAALRAAELGARVTLVERGTLGGTCTNDGCVPTRVLAKGARLVRDGQQYADYGLRGSPPEVDFPRLLARVQHVVYQVHEKKQLEAELIRAGVAVIANAGDAHFVDAHTFAVPGRGELRADHFLLCAGGHARRLPFPGAEHALTHSDVWGMAALPRSLAVVGGAATGCQLASIFAAFGATVTVLDVGPHLLGGEDELVAETIRTAFARRGIDVVTGMQGVTRIKRDEGGTLRLEYTSGSGEDRALNIAAVILAVGWPGNVDALRLEAAGVRVEHGHVVVDEHLRTSAPHIYAAGDLTGRMMLVQSATAEGRAAAEHAVLDTGSGVRHAVVPHGGFTDPEYGSVGMTEAQARAGGVDCAIAAVPYADLDRAVIDGHTEGFCKLIVSRQDRRLLGAHIVGEQAVEVLQIVAAGMVSGMGIEHLAALELAYPTYSAIAGLAARAIQRELDGTPDAPTISGEKLPAPEWEQSEPA